MSIIKSILILIVSFTLGVNIKAQESTSFYQRINQDNGTYVIKDIKKANLNSSSQIIANFYMLNCRQIKNVGSPILQIDETVYNLSQDRSIIITLDEGKHNLSIIDQELKFIYPIKTFTLDFKKDKRYTIDFYLVTKMEGSH